MTTTTSRPDRGWRTVDIVVAAAVLLALTAVLVGRGWHVVVDARDGHRLAAAVAGLDGPGQVEPIAGDVADPAHRRELAEAVAALKRQRAQLEPTA